MLKSQWSRKQSHRVRSVNHRLFRKRYPNGNTFLPNEYDVATVCKWHSQKGRNQKMQHARRLSMAIVIDQRQAFDDRVAGKHNCEQEIIHHTQSCANFIELSQGWDVKIVQLHPRCGRNISFLVRSVSCTAKHDKKKSGTFWNSKMDRPFSDHLQQIGY